MILLSRISIRAKLWLCLAMAPATMAVLAGVGISGTLTLGATVDRFSKRLVPAPVGRWRPA